jgi:hypothetical protein
VTVQTGYPHTLDSLARALRGMPRDAPILVRMPDGSLRRILNVRPLYITAAGTENPAGATLNGQQYAISFEVDH